MTTTTSNENTYFDLITSGIGYLNRYREVKPNQGNPYYCVTIAALNGRSDNVQYTYIDCRIVGGDALELCKAQAETINDRKHKVLVRFNVGDITPSSYETQGGEQRLSLKARLLKITWAKVDETVILESDEQSDKEAVTIETETPEETPLETHGEGAAEMQPAAVEQTADPMDQWAAGLGSTVKLDQDDPAFMRKKEYLKTHNYRWKSDAQCWSSAAA